MDAVVADGFSFAYLGGDEPLLRDVSMRIPEGAFALICGPTGCGKTTLLRCIDSVLAPAGKRSGTLLVFGGELPNVLDVGFVLQEPEDQIVCDTVIRELAFGLENIGMPPEAMRRRIAEVATVFGMGNWMDRKTSELSGGQKQMLNLASVIAMHPRLLLLDEPTSELDPVSSRRLCDMLRLANDRLGMTIVVATHSPEQFRGLPTVAFEIESGVVHEVSPDDVCAFDKCGACYGSQNASGRSGYGDCSASFENSHSRQHTYGEPVAFVSDAWLSFGKDGEWVLRGFDLEAFEGEVLTIVGECGCGKTTALKAIAGVLKPGRGKVRNSLAANQAYLPQDPRLLFECDTVTEELGWSACGNASERDASRAAGVIEAEKPAGDFRGVVPSRWLDELEGMSPLELSGGQRQMLAMSKLLAANPAMLLLDEPAKGLDAAAQLELGCAIRSAAEGGATVIIASHDLSFASRVSDRIAFMFDGQIASCSTPREFFEGALYYRPEPNAFTVAWDSFIAKGHNGDGA